MAEQQHVLIDALMLLAAALLFVPLFQRLRLGSILGYLCVGVFLGPSGLGLIARGDAPLALAEFGVVFLLFSIGLEISFERLRLLGRGLYGLALAQLLVTTTVLAMTATLFGASLTSAVVIGGALSFSSTAVVLQYLSERGVMTAPLPRSAIAILLLQDLAFAPMMAFVAASGRQQPLWQLVLLPVLEFGLLLMIVVVVQHVLLKPLFRIAVHSSAPEMFAGAVLLLVLGMGWLAEQLGLSMALGAFLAGLMVADTEFRHQVAADIQPFRGLLLGLFFASVGVNLDLSFALIHAETVLGLLLGVMMAKAAILTGLALLFGVSRPRALALGLLLSQGSEFGFVIFGLAAARDLLASEDASLLTTVVALSMALTPIGGLALDYWRTRRATAKPSLLGDLAREKPSLDGHVVIAGFGQVGMAVARYLGGERIPTVVLDLSAKRIVASRGRGLPVFYGNAARLDVLRAANLDRARALVVAVPEAETAEQITLVARRAFPNLRIFVRAPDESSVDRLRRAGANAVVPESMTTALDLVERVMIVQTIP